MSVTVQNVAALFAHFYFNCMFYVTRPLFYTIRLLFCFSPIKLSLLFLFFIVLYVLLCVLCVCDLY